MNFDTRVLAALLLFPTLLLAQGLHTFKNGEVADAREQALQRLKEDAARQSGDTIVGLRFASSMIEAGVSEVIAWGTALKDKAD